jgi:type II restriction/modification system DNA methylase subunit YeeA
LTKSELLATLDCYSDDTELAVVWFDKEEIDEDMPDEEWASVCDNLITSDEMLEAARRELLG